MARRSGHVQPCSARDARNRRSHSRKFLEVAEIVADEQETDPEYASPAPNEIAQELGENLSQVSYHIKVLSECGFIELVNTEPRRGAVEHFYRGTRRALLPDEVLHQLPSGIQSGIIGEVLLEIVDDATASLRDGTFNRRDDCHLSWTPLVLDEEGWRGMASLLAETLDRLFDLQAESNERSAREDGSGIPATVAMMGFESSRAPAKGKAAGPDRP